jgi:hypothetical protein
MGTSQSNESSMYELFISLERKRLRRSPDVEVFYIDGMINETFDAII